MLLKNNKTWNLVETHLKDILDMITDPVIIIDNEGIVIYVNQAYEHQVGISRGQILGRNLKKYHPNDKLLQVLRDGAVIKSEEHYDETLGYKIVASFLPIKDLDLDNNTVAVAGIGQLSSIYQIYSRLTPNKPGDQIAHGKTKKEHLPQSFHKLIGESPNFLHCLSLAAQVAASDASIMLRGETGVGKELIARAIHETSVRAGCPFVAVNSAAIPENLIESELFGYDPGAFTGAQPNGKIGKIELANNGTLFLDEIGDLTLSIQVKLLRFLQERYIERIGGNKHIPINVRIITATNKNVEQMIQQGEFREDLYYRINVIPVYIPPLRERHSDISILTYHFLDYYCEKYNKKLTLSSDALDYLQHYNLPGNVRELKNIIEHAVVICSGRSITPDLLKLPFNNAIFEKPADLNLNNAIEYTEKKLIQKALEKAHNNKSKAIEYLGISRGAFYAKLEKYSLNS